MFKSFTLSFCLFWIILSTVWSEEQQNETFQQFIAPHVSFRKDGKIHIPEHIKHVKLDIGLSYNAPMSQYWLTHEDHVLVFGFEPNPAAVNSIMNGAVKRHPLHGEPLNRDYIGVNFFLIPCALGLSTEEKIKFYITKEDCGCSSIYEPKFFAVADVIEVPIFSLSDFFDIFPFDTHPVIDYIKIDAQGSDLNIVKSAKEYLKEHVIFVTIECENSQYKDTTNSEQEVNSYMFSQGFIKYQTADANDPTYLNSRFLDYVKANEVKIFQKG